MNKLCIAVLIAALSLAGCTSQPREGAGAQPDWILGESQDHPRSQYLLGVGDADTLTDAKSRARAEIAKIFNVTVDSVSVDSSRFASASSTAGSYTEESQAVERELRTRTFQLLEGVDIADTWQDPSDGRYYALAALPRLQTAMALRTQIDQLDNASRQYIDDADASTSLFQKIRFAGETIALQKRRQTLNQQLRVVSAVGQGSEAPWSVDELIADRAELLSQITIVPRARGMQSEQLEAALASALANQGMTVSPEGKYTLTATLDSVALPPREGWYFHNANLSIALSGDGGKRLGGHEWQYKASATDSALAESRVLSNAKSYLDNELSQRMFELMVEK